MSNLLNFALGGLTGALSGSPLAPLIGAPLAALTASKTGHATGSASPATVSATPSRDSQIADLGTMSSSVNLLAQLASAIGGTNASAASGEPLSAAPAPPIPAPAKPAAVPTDDHGQSNIVFSDSDVDGSLIH